MWRDSLTLHGWRGTFHNLSVGTGLSSRDHFIERDKSFNEVSLQSEQKTESDKDWDNVSIYLAH